MINVVGWVDVVDNTECDYTKDEYREAVIKSIIDNRYCFSGIQHQTYKCGMPKFNDGSVGFYSQRGWGDLMAKAWNKIQKTDVYKYDDFSWNVPFAVAPKLP